jgi:hypothetical protein
LPSCGRWMSWFRTGSRGGCCSLDWRDGGHTLPLWTALPSQADLELNCLASCKTSNRRHPSKASVVVRLFARRKERGRGGFGGRVHDTAFVCRRRVRAAVNLSQHGLETVLRDSMSLTPRAIREYFALNQPKYARTAAYGHFSRAPEADGGFAWERTDLAERLLRHFA